MKKYALAVVIVLTAAVQVFAEEYAIYLSNVRGSVTVTQDTKGKITVSPKISSGKVSNTNTYSETVVIDGNTAAGTASTGYAKKPAKNGDTVTWTNADGSSRKTVVKRQGYTISVTINSRR